MTRPGADPDGSSDARVVLDAASVDGGGADANGDGGPAPTFADDFDRDALGAGWTGVKVIGNASLAFEASGGGRALRLVVEGRTSTDLRSAELHRSLPPGKGIACEVDVRIDAGPTGGDTTLLFFDMAGPTASNFNLRVNASASKGGLWQTGTYAQGGTFDEGTEVVDMPRSRWFKLRFETDYAAARVLYDDKLVTSISLVTAQVPATLSVGVGEWRDEETSASSILFDDLRCFATPL